MATDPMSNLPAGLPPEDYSDYLNAQRQSMLAQALMGSALTPLQAPQTESVRGLYVQPRIGAVAVASKLADALLGRQAQNQAMQSQIGLQQQIARSYAPQQVIPGQQLQAAPQGPDAGSNATGDNQGVAPLVQRQPGMSLAQTVQSSQPSMSAPNPRNPYNMPADAVARLAMSDPKAYTDMLQGTPEWKNALITANGDPIAARQIMVANATKAAEVERKSGQGYQNYLTGQQGISPDPALGSSFKVNPDGTVTATPIANAADIAAQRAGLTSGAETAGKVANTPQQFQTQGGGTTAPMYPGQVPGLGLPPGYVPPGGQGPTPLAQLRSGPNTNVNMPPPGAQPGMPPSGAAAGAPARPQPAASAGPNGGQQPRQNDYFAGISVYKPGQGLGGQSTMGKASDQAVVDAHGKNMTELGAQSIAAMNGTRNNAQMLPHLANATFGEGGDAISHLRSVLAHTGLVPQSQLDQLSDTEVAGKYLTRNGTEGLLARYGRVTQGEVNLAVSKQAPNLGQQPQSVLKLTIADDINNAYLQQKAQDYQGYAQLGGDPRDFERWYAGSHPIDDFSKQHGPSIASRDTQLFTSGGGQVPGANPGVMPALPPASAHAGAVVRGPQGYLRSDGSTWKPFTPGAPQ